MRQSLCLSLQSTTSKSSRTQQRFCCSTDWDAGEFLTSVYVDVGERTPREGRASGTAEAVPAMLNPWWLSLWPAGKRLTCLHPRTTRQQWQESLWQCPSGFRGAHNTQWPPLTVASPAYSTTLVTAETLTIPAPFPAHLDPLSGDACIPRGPRCAEASAHPVPQAATPVTLATARHK